MARRIHCLFAHPVFVCSSPRVGRYTYTVADARLATFGHLQADTLIDHPSIDGYVSPYPYFATARSPGGAMYAGGQLDAPWLRRKLWLIEDDSRTSLAEPGPFRFCNTMADTINLLNIFTAALHANALYWFDLENKGWFGQASHPEATKEIWAALSAAVKATSRLRLPPSQQRQREQTRVGALPAPQVAVFFDTQAPITQLVDSGGSEQNMDGSLTYLESPGGSWALVNSSQELAKLGAPVRHYYLSDLPRLDASQIRLAVFLNAFAPTVAQRASIRGAFGGSNATLLFIGPAGLVSAMTAADGGSIRDASGVPQRQRTSQARSASCSTDNALVSELIGISGLRPRAGGAAAAMTTITSAAAASGGRFADVTRDLAGLTFGNPVPFAPLFYWSGTEEEEEGEGEVNAQLDTKMEVLGQYAGTNLPSLVAASETAHGYHVVYSGAPALPAALLRALARSAGVHLYTSDGAHATTDAIDAIGNGLHVHAGPTAGDRRIALPVPLLVEAEDGSAVCATPCVSFDARNMSAGESRLYYVTRPSAGSTAPAGSTPPAGSTASAGSTPPMPVPMPDDARTSSLMRMPAPAGQPHVADSAFLAAESFSWLSDLAAPAIVNELSAVSTKNARAFREDWQGLAAPGTSAHEWSALTLLNRGRLDEQGCKLAPATCAVLGALLLRGQLQPRKGTAEVGARLLRLGPGASLRPHRGLGGRLVAHVGIVTPAGATLTVQGETREWETGKVLVFDDHAEHHAENRGTEARVVLHVAFPKGGRRSTAASPPIATIAAGSGSFRVQVYANCTAQTTLLADGRRSALLPLLTLYNRVDDNLPADNDACVSVSRAGDHTLRIVAAHGYGTVDVRWKVSDAWITWELAALGQWHADPIEKHLQLARLEVGLLDPLKAPFATGRFQGNRGLEGREEWSCGFFTLSSAWQRESARLDPATSGRSPRLASFAVASTARC